MDISGLDYKQLPDGLQLKIRVQPRASRNKIAGVTGDCLKLCLTAPPVDGEANQACITYLAELLKIAKNRITIVAGHTSRNKIIKISDFDLENFCRLIECSH